MLARLRCLGPVISALALGCAPSVGVEAPAGNGGAGGGAASTTGAGGVEPALTDPGVRLSQGEPCCSIHDGKGTCCHKPNADPGTVGPWEIVGIDDAVDIALSFTRVALVRVDGSVLQWENGVSQPAVVPGINDAVKVAVGDTWGENPPVCSLRANGTVACWNGNAPVKPVADLGGVVQLSGTHLGFICTRTGGGKVVCLSNGAEPGMFNVMPMDVHDAVDISAGYGGICAVREDGSIWCWDYDGTTKPFPPT